MGPSDLVWVGSLGTFELIVISLGFGVSRDANEIFEAVLVVEGVDLVVGKG